MVSNWLDVQSDWTLTDFFVVYLMGPLASKLSYQQGLISAKPSVRVPRTLNQPCPLVSHKFGCSSVTWHPNCRKLKRRNRSKLVKAVIMESIPLGVDFADNSFNAATLLTLTLTQTCTLKWRVKHTAEPTFETQLGGLFGGVGVFSTFFGSATVTFSQQKN